MPTLKILDNATLATAADDTTTLNAITIYGFLYTQFAAHQLRQLAGLNCNRDRQHYDTWSLLTIFSVSKSLLCECRAGKLGLKYWRTTRLRLARPLLTAFSVLNRSVLYKCFSTNIDVVQFVKGLIFAPLDHGPVLRVLDMKGSTVHILDGASS